MIRPYLRRWGGRFPAGWVVIGGVTAVNLLLAAVSFLKDLVFAGYFGTSAMADAVNIAFLLPDAISANLFAYVIGVAAVPYLTRMWSSEKREDFVSVAKGLAVHSVLAMAFAAVLLLLFMDPVLSWFGTSGATGRQLERMFLLLLPCMLLFPLLSVGGAALQAIGVFYVPALSPVIFNLSMLAVLTAAWSGTVELRTGGWLYSGSIVLGCLLAAALPWWYLSVKASVLRPGSTALMEKRRPVSSWLLLPIPIYRDALPFFLIILFTQSLYAVERVLASHGPTGTLAGLNYAYRLAQFPNWVFITALTSVILPALSRSNPSPADSRTFPQAIRVTILVMIPSALILCAGREPIIAFLFGRGAFDAASVEITSALLAGYSLSVVGQALSAVCLRYCLAKGSLRAPVWIYACTALSNVLFDAAMLDVIGPAALGYGALLGWSINAAMMVAFVVRDSKNRRGLP